MQGSSLHKNSLKSLLEHRPTDIMRLKSVKLLRAKSYFYFVSLLLALLILPTANAMMIVSGQYNFILVLMRLLSAHLSM